MDRQGKIVLLGIFGVFIYSMTFLLEGCNQPKENKETKAGNNNNPVSFVGHLPANRAIPKN